MDKDSVMYQLMDLRVNTVLNSILATDKDYQEIKRKSESEVVGPSAMFDLMVIMPCTGNTVAKLANGITDSSPLFLLKSHIHPPITT